MMYRQEFVFLLPAGYLGIIPAVLPTHVPDRNVFLAVKEAYAITLDSPLFTGNLFECNVVVLSYIHMYVFIDDIYHTT